MMPTTQETKKKGPKVEQKATKKAEPEVVITNHSFSTFLSTSYVRQVLFLRRPYFQYDFLMSAVIDMQVLQLNK